MRSTAFTKAILAVAFTAITFSAAAAVPESKDPIKITVLNWTSQIVQSHITGDLLEKLGYNVKYVPANDQLQFTALGTGDLDVEMEVWEQTNKDNFYKALKAGHIIDAGNHAAKTREEWWYPDYVAKLCPGLPSWKALNKCAEIFATPETKPKGRYLAGPVDWKMGDKQRVEALGMNFTVINAGQAASLWAELKSAYRRKQPIVLFNWTPNWVETVYPGHFVEFPPFDPKCISDPSWGPNPNATHDCGSPKGGWLKKAVWKGMAKKWPCALSVIRNISFTKEELDGFAKSVDVDGMSYEQAASKWLTDHKNQWSKWVSQCGV